MTLGRDAIAGLVCLAISLVGLYFSFGLPQLPLVPVGPGFYPRIVLAFLAILSVILVAQDLLARRAPVRAAERRPARRVSGNGYRLVGLVFAVFGLYVAALPALGYRIATALFVAAMQAALDRPRDARGWAVLAAIAVAASAATYLVFDTYLTVLLPRGRWTNW
ncbi:MAG TPA: tripartite tricarboxylate transporter TctB family protein [Alphaproteobacteria bacterium]|nr:tripartite tricarboxylate transporter TctB family protein [Alphaproteobacteria bacterium]